MSSIPNETLAFLRRLDLIVLSASIVTFFLALASMPWWTLTGTTARNLLNIQISPYFLQISATGFPPTVPLANGLGSFTRVIVILGAAALLAASFKPTAWWRNLAVYFGLASIIELYLSFALMFYWAQSAFATAYGVVPPYYGSQIIAAVIIGLDFRTYTSPLVTASFTLPYYLGYLGIALVLGRSLVKLLQDRALQLLASLLPGAGIHDVYLTPPYQHIWFSSGDQQYNPLVTDPEKLNDDELLVSFQKLYQTVEPGGSLSIILPDWATMISDRLQKLMPNTGFTTESVGTVYRTTGKPEQELRFRKPLQASSAQTMQVQETIPIESASTEEFPSEPHAEIEAPPVVESGKQPNWALTRMTRVERTILKAAIDLITEKQEPVPYRELINHAYMELINKKIEFESARQIENTLLDHSGRELLLIEEPDMTTGTIHRKWWLGEQKLTEEGKHLPTLKIVSTKGWRLPRPRMLKVKNPISKVRKPRYKKKKKPNDDSDDSSNYDSSSETPLY